LIVTMAELATPSAAQVATADATAPQEKQQNVRPEKPDEEKYKEDLAKAEKEHQAAQDKLVRLDILNISLNRSHVPVAAVCSMPPGSCSACEPCTSHNNY
jgi:hypothetical protein